MKKSMKVAIAGAILFVVSLLLGVSGTIVGMIRSFNSAAEPGGVSPDELAQGIGTSLIGTLIAIPFALVGLCLLVGGVVAYVNGRGQRGTEERSA